jgi:hypothetical protein
MDPRFGVCRKQFFSSVAEIQGESRFQRMFIQGCQTVYFRTKMPILGKFWMVLKWKVLVYFIALWSVLQPFGIHTYLMVIWYILWSFAIFYGHLLYFMVICYILWSFVIFLVRLVYFSRFGILYKEKSGNPVFIPYVDGLCLKSAFLNSLE